jgi:hypothetical protein
MTEFKNLRTALQYTNDPLQNFLYALKAPDSKRQCPRRFEYFLDYLGLNGTLLIFVNIFNDDNRSLLTFQISYSF